MGSASLPVTLRSKVILNPYLAVYLRVPAWIIPQQYTSESGAAGSKVSVHKSVLLSALTMNTNTLVSDEYGSADNTNGGAANQSTNFDATFATAAGESFLDLSDISVGVITQALENISFLRSQNGGTQSRLTFNLNSISTQKTNMRAALGRVVDVDLEETTNLAKYSILQQSAASILAQANRESTDVALMLLR